MQQRHEILPQPKGRVTTQFAQVHKLADGNRSAIPGPGMLVMQTVHGAVYKQDPMERWKKRMGGGGGATGVARWG